MHTHTQTQNDCSCLAGPGERGAKVGRSQVLGWQSTGHDKQEARQTACFSKRRVVLSARVLAGTSQLRHPGRQRPRDKKTRPTLQF